MKNSLTLKLAALLLLHLTRASSIQAQGTHQLSFGLGANFSDIAITIDGESPDENPFSSRSGLQFDFAYSYRKQALAIDVFMGYSQQGAEQRVNEFESNGVSTISIQGTVTSRLNYFYISPVVGVNLDALSGEPGRFHARFGIGPWIGIGLGGTERLDLTFRETGPGFSATERVVDSREIEVGSDSPSQMNGFVFGFQGTIRLEFDVSDRVSIYVEPRYLFGLSDITPDGTSNPSPNVNYLHRTATVAGGVGIRL